MDSAAANFVRAEIAARVGPILQIEGVNRMPIGGDFRGSCQGTSILLEAVDHFGSRLNKLLPAQEPGGRYKGNTRRCKVLFVAAAPSRVLRDGAGMLLFKLAHHPL